MKKEYLHLWVYPCDLCAGPVVAGSTAIRENEISKEINVQQVGAICLSCGHRQDKTTELVPAKHLPPIAWESPRVTGDDLIKPALIEALNHAEGTNEEIRRMEEPVETELSFLAQTSTSPS